MGHRSLSAGVRWKMMALQGKRGRRQSWKWGLRGSILAQMRTPNIVLQKDAFWFCCRGGSASLGSGAFCLQLAAGLFLDQGTGKRLGQVAWLRSATSPTSSHCHRHDHTSFSWSDGPRWSLMAVVPCTSLLAQPCTFDHLMSPALLKISLATPQGKFLSIQFSGSLKTKQKYVIYWNNCVESPLHLEINNTILESASIH